MCTELRPLPLARAPGPDSGQDAGRLGVTSEVTAAASSCQLALARVACGVPGAGLLLRVRCWLRVAWV
jgi:hypothetical protein